MVLVFDVGATHTRIALSEDDYSLGTVDRLETHNSEAGFAKFIAEVKRISKDSKLEAVAGGLPGQIDSESGMLKLADNLTEWNGIPVRRALEEAVGCRVVVENDVVMAGVGEAQEGAAGKSGVAAYFTVSTGVNGVRLVNGWADKTIRQYNLGHLLLTDSEGHVVGLETLTGGNAFSRRKKQSPKDVRDGRSWRAEEHHLANGLFNTALLWGPERIVFGGSMMRDIDLESLQGELDLLPSVLDPRPKLLHAQLGDTAGLHGSLAMIRHKRH